MNVLLLLSALLSALTGVNVGGVRTPVAAEQVARTAQAVTAAVAPAAAHVPVQTVDRITPLLAAVVVVRLPMVSPPLYASRRRE